MLNSVSVGRVTAAFNNPVVASFVTVTVTVAFMAS